MLKYIVLALSAVVCLAEAQNVFRPCPLNNQQCIRNSLRLSSRCSPAVKGRAPPVLTVPQARFETPSFNSSYVDNNLVIKGLDRCVVSEYFINPQTKRGVLALDCPWLTISSDRVMYQHYSLREDGVFRYSISGSYPLIRLTTTFGSANRVDICQEFTFADVTALPLFNIDPKDLPTQKFLTRDLTYLNIYERECFLYRAKLLARSYINSALCDFGCNE